MSIAGRTVVLGVALGLVAACAAAPPKPEVAAPAPPALAPPALAPPLDPITEPPPSAPALRGAMAPEPARPAPPAPPPAPAAPPPLPEVFESEEFVLAAVKPGDTAQKLAERFLGDPAKAWMIEDYNGALAPGQRAVVPRRPWNLAGVDPTGYQLVPVLCYHNIAPQMRGRLTMSVKTFEEQMGYLKTQGYRVVSLAEFLEFTALKRQLPAKTVVLTFDDGWKSFRQHAYPVLKQLGFNATLFIYTDFVGAPSAMSWAELRELAREGFDLQAHSKTHDDLRRRPNEPDADYARRMQAELAQPLALFQRQIGQTPRILAYPYGAHDDEVARLAREAGYVGAFDVRRQGNPSFAQPLSIHRSQIYADMSLEDFAKNLNVFNQEPVK